jgi:regulator of protease activity HflC (stomatin/prohibitin superfamily)
MLALIIVILAVVVALVASGVALAWKPQKAGYGSDNDNTRGIAIFVAVIAFLVAIGVFIGGSIVTVPNGNVAVMVRFGKTTGELRDAGLSGKPIIDNAVVMSIQTQLFTDDAKAASKDLQDVTATIAINYKLDKSQAVTVYRTIGVDYIGVIANPIVQETVKEVTSRYNAEDMILKRNDVKNEISSSLIEKLALRGIVCESVNIVNFAFSPEFTKAIEAKVVAVQKVAEAENKLKQIEVEARQAEQVAKGQAAAVIALADGQAQANAILSKSLTPEIIQYMFIQTIKNTDKVVTVPGGIALTLPEVK